MSQPQQADAFRPITPEPPVDAPSPPPRSPWRRTWSRMFGHRELTFEEAWHLERSGRAPALHPSVRSPAVRDSRHRLRAAYLATPVLDHLHRALPQVVVEGSSVDVAEHLDGDYWPDQALIRIECHHPIDVIAFTVLHEFGHAVDHLTITDAERARLEHSRGFYGWRSAHLDWDYRGEEWFAESFAHWWWPSVVEASRPAWRLPFEPIPAQYARRLFDPGEIAVRAGTALSRRSLWRS